MKKFAVILMALCLALSMAGMAEETGIAIENEPAYEGQYVTIGETGLCFYLPNDWTATEAPEGVVGEVYVSPDGQTVLTVTTGEGNLNEVLEQYKQAVQDGSFKESNVVNINGLDWVMSTTADNLQNYAQCQMDEATILSFVFVVADASMDVGETELQMLGSLAAAE